MFQLVGYERRQSKSGNVGYLLHIIEPIPQGKGEGSRSVNVFSYGRASAPYVSEDFFRRFEVDTLVGYEVKLSFNRFGSLDSISL